MKQSTGTAHVNGEAAALIYDADCRLCVTAKRSIEKLAKQGVLADLRFVPYQSGEAAGFLKEHYIPGRPEAAFLVERDGSLRKGLDAFLPLLPGLKGGYALRRLVQVSWLKPFVYLLYRFVARHRYRLFGPSRTPVS